MAMAASASTAQATITTHPIGHFRAAWCSLGDKHLSSRVFVARKPALRVEGPDHLRRSTPGKVRSNPRGFRCAVSCLMNPMFLSFTTIRKIKNAIAENTKYVTLSYARSILSTSRQPPEIDDGWLVDLLYAVLSEYNGLHVGKLDFEVHCVRFFNVEVEDS
jgi:hypothetical protein